MNKTLFITGGAKRIGAEIVKHYANCGYNIALHCNKSIKEANVLAQSLGQCSQYQVKKIKIYQADITNTAHLLQMLNNVYNDFAIPSLIINNASVFEKSSAENFDESLFDLNFSTHLKAPIKICSFFYAKAKQAKLPKAPCVINICDSNVARGKTQYFNYLLSKQSLAQATKLMASEFAPLLRINAIMPGYISGAEGEDVSYLASLEKKIPLQKKGSPANIIEAINYLNTSPYITAQQLFVDGGLACVSL